MIMDVNKPIKLDTENYYLRALDCMDATEKYLDWLRDPEVNKYLEARLQSHSIETIKEYIASHDNDSSYLLGVFYKPDGTHVGNYSARCNLYHKTATLGLMIGDRQHWGRRIVLETRAEVLNFLFNEVSMQKIHGACYSNNFSAVYNYKSQGFQNEGILKSHVLSEGKRRDLLMFSMDRDRWISKK